RHAGTAALLRRYPRRARRSRRGDAAGGDPEPVPGRDDGPPALPAAARRDGRTAVQRPDAQPGRGRVAHRRRGRRGVDARDDADRGAAARDREFAARRRRHRGAARLTPERVGARITPYEALLHELESIAWPQIQEEAAARGTDTRRRDEFVLLGTVGAT